MEFIVTFHMKIETGNIFYAAGVTQAIYIPTVNLMKCS